MGIELPFYPPLVFPYFATRGGKTVTISSDIRDQLFDIPLEPAGFGGGEWPGACKDGGRCAREDCNDAGGSSWPLVLGPTRPALPKVRFHFQIEIEGKNHIVGRAVRSEVTCTWRTLRLQHVR